MFPDGQVVKLVEPSDEGGAWHVLSEIEVLRINELGLNISEWYEVPQRRIRDR